MAKLSKIEEIALLSQCALADNRRAFGRLVEAYQPQVRHMLLNLTLGDEDLTDDLAQETFVKAYLAIRGFKGLSSFGTWIYRIALREFYNEKRRRTEMRTQQVPEPGESPHDGTDAQMTVQAALARLGDDERTAITLFYLQDLPIRRIAAITGEKEGTVKARLSRARDKMRAFIGRDNL